MTSRLGIVLALFLMLPGLAWAHGGQYAGPGFPGGTYYPSAGPPPGPGSGRPRGSSTPNTRQWETWWGYNKEQFLPIRGVSPPIDEQIGRYGSGGGRPPTRDEVRRLIVPELVTGLSDADPEVRSACAVALGKVGDARDVETLANVLKDRQRMVVESAILGLGLIRADTAREILTGIVNDTSRSGRERGMALLGIGVSGGQEAQAWLAEGLSGRPQGRALREQAADLPAIRALAAGLATGADLPGAAPGAGDMVAGHLQRAIRSGLDRERSFLSGAFTGLAKTRDANAENTVLAGLRHPDRDVRAAAAIAAGRVFRDPGRKVVAELARILDSESDLFPRRLLLISLGYMGGPQAIRLLDPQLAHKDSQHRAFAALGLAIAGDTSRIESFRRSLVSERAHSLQGAFAIALGILGDKGSIPILTQELKETRDPTLRGFYVQALALIGDPSAAPAVEAILADTNVAELQAASAIALGLLGDFASSSSLVDILQGSGTITVKGAAATGLGRMGDHRLMEPLLKFVKDKRQQDLSRAFGFIALGILGENGARTPPFARVSIDSNYGLRNGVFDEVTDIL